MGEFFLRVLNVSLTAAWIVPVVLCLRLLFAKAPKWIHCLLWCVVALRLLFPFSPESVLSLIPSAAPLPEGITMSDAPTIQSGISVLDDAINPVLSESMAPAVGDSVNPMQVAAALAGCVWCVGVAVMLLLALLSYLRILRRVRVSLCSQGRVYRCDTIDTSFVLGLLRPRIYLPSGMDAVAEDYVLRHERAHLRRGDHLWKPLGFLLLAVHWFNPMLWVAYILLCRDIERACDEHVIRDMDGEEKKGYSEALLSCSIHDRRMVMVCPLAFGEVGVKARIRSILNYQKPAFWIVLASLLASVIVAVCFLTNPPTEETTLTDIYRPVEVTEEALATLRMKYPQYFSLDTTEGLDVYVWQMAPSSYSCGMLAGTEMPSFEVLLNLRGTSVEEMKAILSSYGIERSKIRLIAYHQLYSSHAYLVDEAYLARLDAMFDLPGATRRLYESMTGVRLAEDPIVGDIWKTHVLNPDGGALGIYSSHKETLVDPSILELSPTLQPVNIIYGSPIVYVYPLEHTDVSAAIPILRFLEAHVVEAVSLPKGDALSDKDAWLSFRPASDEFASYIHIELNGTYMVVKDISAGVAQCFRLDIDVCEAIEQLDARLSNTSS